MLFDIVAVIVSSIIPFQRKFSRFLCFLRYGSGIRSSSSLDPPSELDINEKLFRLGMDKTVLLISPRLSAMKDVDIIYNIEHGRVIEVGFHDDLIRKNGKYVEMYNAQSESYKA